MNHQVTNLLSLKFLHWDDALSELEQQKGIADKPA